MGFIVWIIFGALAGWIATVIAGATDRNGALANILIGIVGSVTGGYIMSIFGYSGITGFDLKSLIVAVFGAVISLWIYRSVSIRA